MANFDLMKNKPALDIPTLNFVWDTLWRSNAANKPINAEQRARSSERAGIMRRLQELADEVEQSEIFSMRVL